MTTIEDATEAQLKAELAKRQVTSKVPEPLERPDFSELRQMIIDGVNRAHAEKFQDEDFGHYVYETAVVAVYGPLFWKWRNGQKY